MTDPNYGRQSSLVLAGGGRKKREHVDQQAVWQLARQARVRAANLYLANVVDWLDDPMPYPTDYYPSTDHP